MGDRFRTCRLLAALVGLWLVAAPAVPAEAVTQSDLQATVRALSFLDSLQHSTTVHIGVVYGEGGESSAAHVAGMLSGLRGSNFATINAVAVSLDEFGHGGRRYDAVFLMPGLSANAKKVADAVRQYRLVSISTDPACLNGGYCVLMVRTDGGVKIVLDTGLANATGARFASVFALMVKRK